MNLKEQQIDPLQTFISGQKRVIYDELLDFTTQKKPDLSSSQLERLQAFLNDPIIYADNRLQKANVEMTEIKVALREKLEVQRKQALARIEHLQQQMVQMPEFEQIFSDQQARLNEAFTQIAETVQNQELTVSIRDKISDFERNNYPELLTAMHKMIAAKSQGKEQEGEQPVSVVYEHLHQIPVAFSKNVLENETDVAEYVEAIKQALLQAIRDNKRVNL